MWLQINEKLPHTKSTKNKVKRQTARNTYKSPGIYFPYKQRGGMGRKKLVVKKMNHPKVRWAKNLGDNRWKYKWLVNLWTSEMQIKTMRCHFKLIILANFKNTLKLWIRIGRNTQEGNWKILSKLKIFISSELAALPLEIYPIEKFTLQYTDIYIHYSVIYNNKKQKTPQ